VAIAQPIQPITEDDDSIRRSLEDAFVPALIPALAQLTGDMSILRDDLRPPGYMPGMVQGGLTEEQQQKAKDLAFEVLRRLRDNPPTPSQRAIEDDLREIMTWMTGAPAAEEYVPLLIEELAPAGQDPRAPTWRMEPGVSFKVAIIGAGMSGILAAIRLGQAGVPYVILEKNPDVGGTWYDNTYPGARVDVPNAFYSYSFAQKADWPKFFSTQETLLDYFRAIAQEYGVDRNTRFNTEVLSMSFDDDRATWSLRVGSSGTEETIEANAIISAVGQLNQPKMPDIPGMASFSGPSFHSARWDHKVDLAGKRVAVIGSGASAAQFVPVIAEQATELTIFQRTPNWFIPVPTYHDDVPAGLRYLLSHVPHYAHWYRFWLFWNSTEGMLPAATVDPEWKGEGPAVSQANEELRGMLGMYLQALFADRPDLAAKVMPQYPPSAKRIILENGSWAASLKRENVLLVTDGIREIRPGGVVTDDGTTHEADVIIYATGFQASRFLTPMSVTGRRGIDINEQWAGDANAYLGITVPNFPNFFMMYGPNTNIVVNGSIIYFSECEMQYILGCVRMLVEGGHRALDCRRDVHAAYVERINAANKLRTWGASTVNSWYKNDRGHVTQNWPGNLLEYWQLTREPHAADYDLL